MALLFAFLTIALLVAGCSSQGSADVPAIGLAQSATATTGTSATPIPAVTTGSTAASPTPRKGIVTPIGETGGGLPITSTATVASTAVATGTVVLPTPTGAAPDPLSVLNIFQFFPASTILVKRDMLNLDGTSVDQAMFTISAPRIVTTSDVTSNLGVLTYDNVYFRWNLAWRSDPISGTASPLPAANGSSPGGYNGGDLLRTGNPILAARTTTIDGRAHLYLWRWNKQTNKGEPLKMLAPGSSTEKNAQFDADLDVNLVDINDDGIYEVVADNLTDVQIWKWDGNRFISQEAR